MLPLLLLACVDSTSSKPPEAGTDSPPLSSGTTDTPSDATCPGPTALVTPDAEAAARGLARLQEGLGLALFPRLALDWLWLVWGEGVPADDATYQADFRARYGLAEAPFDNDGYPLGLHAVDSTWATVDCLLCHADTVAGVTVLGAGNSRLDFEGLYADLQALNEVAGAYGLPTVNLPYTLEGRTAAAGATDAFGLGMELSLLYAPDAGIHTWYGFQQSAPWWNLAYKDRVYADGAGDASGHRTMAAMMLGFGVPLATIQDQDADLADVRAAQLAMAPPAWPFDPPDDEAVQAGRAIYEAVCAECHGSVCTASAPVVVDADTIGTDPTRAEAFGALEAAWVNASWFGEDAPMEATGGYLAQPLVGVWASAPYFHNGSVPDLAAVLDPIQRPIRWRRTGDAAEDYDAARVGWRTTEPETSEDDSIDGRKTYDTTRPGLSAAGHEQGEALDDLERSMLLEFLKTL